MWIGIFLSLRISPEGLFHSSLENNNVVVFPFLFSHLQAVKLVVHPPSRIVSHYNDKKLSLPLPDDPPCNVVIAHSLPLGGVDRDFRFIEDQTRSRGSMAVC